MRIIMLIIFLNCMFADQRNFVWTYENIMLEPGETELELYFTNYLPNFDILGREQVNIVHLGTLLGKCTLKWSCLMLKK